MAAWARTLKLDLMGIQETHIAKDSEIPLGDYTFFNSGSLQGAGGAKIGGVGLLVHKRLERLVCNVQRKGHRLLTVEFKKINNMYAGIDCTVAYAPHSGYEDAERDNFWAELNYLEENKKDSYSKLRLLFVDANGEISRGNKSNSRKWHENVGKATRAIP